MSTTKTAPVRLSRDCYSLVKSHAKAEHRSISAQAEYLIEIGQAALDNPDLPIDMIRKILIAREETPVKVNLREWL